MAFSLHSKLLATLIGPVEILRTWSRRTFLKKIRLYGTFYTEIFKRPFYTLTAMPWTNRTKKFLAFLELLKFLGNICSFEQLFDRKKSSGASV